MRLYFKPGACSLASRIVMIELGCAFEGVKVDTDTGLTEQGENYRLINPRGYVPALQLDDGRVITENPAVLQYLGAMASGSLVPAADSWERVRLQEALNFISSELHKAFSPFFNGSAVGERLAPAHAMLARRIGDIERMLADGGPYLLGEQMTVADIYLFVVLNWAGFIDVSLADWPPVTEFMALMRGRASVETALRQEGLLKADA